MRPFIELHIERPTNDSLFFNEPSDTNLINVLKTVCFDLNTYIGDLSMQRERVLALNYAIKTTLKHYCYNNPNYTINSFKYFIRIVDTSMSNFNIQVQLLLNNKLTTFTLIK
jgi:hypothetical protein